MVGHARCSLTAVVAVNAVEARLELVAALALALHAVVEVADVAGNISGRRQGSQREKKGRLEGSHCDDGVLRVCE